MSRPIAPFIILYALLLASASVAAVSSWHGMIQLAVGAAFCAAIFGVLCWDEFRYLRRRKNG